MFYIVKEICKYYLHFWRKRQRKVRKHKAVGTLHSQV